GWQASGMDHMAFHVSTNPGSPLSPIHKIASGGELSRFMLALKVVLSDIASVPTLIFDEVDTGIGGAVADAVGKRLSILGQYNQVLVNNHQPQVASKCTSHYKVIKTQSKSETESTVIPLSEVQRREEIARMLSGADITEEARAAAEKLLA